MKTQNEIKEEIFIFLNNISISNKEFRKSNYKFNANKIAEKLEFDVRTIRKYISEFELENSVAAKRIKKINFILDNVKNDEDIKQINIIKDFYNKSVSDFDDYNVYNQFNAKYSDIIKNMTNSIHFEKKAKISALNEVLNNKLKNFDLNNDIDKIEIKKNLKLLLSLFD
jgi:hypothetical protein